MKLFLILILASIMISCGSNADAETSSDNSIFGTWAVIGAEGMMADANLGTNYIFEDGSLTLSKDGYDNKATCTLTDSTFTWDNGSMVMEYNYSFKKEYLIVKPKGSDQKLTLEKK